MNILLVNFILRANHGGILQCYALQELLKSMGHNVVKPDLIEKREFQFSIILILKLIKRIFERFLLKKNNEILAELNNDRKNLLPRQNAISFINKYLNIIRVNSLDELDGKDYDAVIVGSDQVWRKPFTDKLLTNKSTSDNAFLAFTEKWNCKRIAYAVSIGVDYWEYNEEETRVLRELIKKFDAVSVREDSAIQLIHENLSPDIKVNHVLDPTLLIPKEKYIDIVRESRVMKSNGNLLIYILDSSEEKTKIIEMFAEKYEYTPFLVNNPNTERANCPVNERIQTSIPQWLRGFMDAEFVIADSFHACVFSIIFEKPFFVLANVNRGLTRISSLLRMFGLEDRLISDFSIEDINLSPINWKEVNSKKEIIRNYSIDFIKNALS